MSVTDETAAKFAGHMLCAVVSRANRPVPLGDLAALLRVGGCDMTLDEFERYLENGAWVTRAGRSLIVPTSRAVNADYLEQEAVITGTTGSGELVYKHSIAATPTGACHFILDILGGRK